jgi:hypothetical protein
MDIFSRLDISETSRYVTKNGQISQFLVEWTDFDNPLYYKINEEWQKILDVQISRKSLRLLFSNCKVQIPTDDDVSWAVLSIERTIKFNSHNGESISIPMFLGDLVDIDRPEIDQEDWWKVVLFLENIIKDQKRQFNENVNGLVTLNTSLELALSQAQKQIESYKALLSKTLNPRQN